MNFQGYKPNGKGVINAKDFKVTDVSKEEEDAKEEWRIKLNRFMNKRIGFQQNPHGEFTKLIHNGTLNKVIDAKMRAEDCSLMQELHPERDQDE